METVTFLEQNDYTNSLIQAHLCGDSLFSLAITIFNIFKNYQGSDQGISTASTKWKQGCPQLALSAEPTGLQLVLSFDFAAQTTLWSSIQPTGSAVHMPFGREAMNQNWA